jgi:ribosomal protein S18 acetylase RimI-like enzyme
VTLRDVTVWYLEMTEPGQMAPAPPPLEGVQVRLAEIASPELARAMYAGVGADWWWIERLDWDWQRWHDHLARAQLETWLIYDHGTPAGYAELEATGDAVEIAGLGLLPAFIGRGLGSRLLDAALRRAWRMTEPPPRRVWLHTSSLDGPAALRNYEARGLRRRHEETFPVDLPEHPPEPWPGAHRPPAPGSRAASEPSSPGSRAAPEPSPPDAAAQPSPPDAAAQPSPPALRWLVDAMNVIGSRPDGWWRDRDAAVRRLLEQLRAFAAGGEPVTVVLDAGDPALAGRDGALEVVLAPRRGRDAADDEIARRLAVDPDPGGVRVVTSDGALAARARALGAAVEGARAFRRRLEGGSR